MLYSVVLEVSDVLLLMICSRESPQSSQTMRHLLCRTPDTCHTWRNQTIWLVNKAASNPAASAPHVAVLFIISPPDFAGVVELADGLAVGDIVDTTAAADEETAFVGDPLERAATTPPWTSDGVLLVALSEALLYPARLILLSELRSTSGISAMIDAR